MFGGLFILTALLPDTGFHVYHDVVTTPYRASYVQSWIDAFTAPKDKPWQVIRTTLFGKSYLRIFLGDVPTADIILANFPNETGYDLAVLDGDALPIGHYYAHARVNLEEEVANIPITQKHERLELLDAQAIPHPIHSNVTIIHDSASMTVRQYVSQRKRELNAVILSLVNKFELAEYRLRSVLFGGQRPAAVVEKVAAHYAAELIDAGYRIGLEMANELRNALALSQAIALAVSRIHENICFLKPESVRIGSFEVANPWNAGDRKRLREMFYADKGLVLTSDGGIKLTHQTTHSPPRRFPMYSYLPLYGRLLEYAQNPIWYYPQEPGPDNIEIDSYRFRNTGNVMDCLYGLHPDPVDVAFLAADLLSVGDSVRREKLEPMVRSWEGSGIGKETPFIQLRHLIDSHEKVMTAPIDSKLNELIDLIRKRDSILKMACQGKRIWGPMEKSRFDTFVEARSMGDSTFRRAYYENEPGCMDKALTQFEEEEKLQEKFGEVSKSAFLRDFGSSWQKVKERVESEVSKLAGAGNADVRRLTLYAFAISGTS